jgi:signal transduction histidine kinase
MDSEAKEDGPRGARRRAVISFTDTGTGIPPEETEAIFELYRSTKKGGTGLGLAIAQQIVERHGGTITVESEVGRGSTFQVILPETDTT